MLSETLAPAVPGVLEALRDATRSRHAALAASPAMARLFNAAYTLSEYRAHLGRLLGLFEPLENAVALVAPPAEQVRAVKRSCALRVDLRSMGLSAEEIDALARCQRLPPIAPAGLPGYSYVMLGSMLGGKIIVQRLRSVLGPGASFRFYGDGQGRPEALWASFCAGLEENKSDVDAICRTAAGIFDVYTAWLSEPPHQTGAL